MKIIGLGLGFAAMFIVLILSGAASDNQTFSGDIMDSKCAGMDGHAQMLKEHEDLHTATECTRACVKQGAKFVLFNSLTKMTYQLDDQTKPSQFAGESVSVSGTLDESSKTIHVADIKMLPPQVPFPSSDQPH